MERVHAGGVATHTGDVGEEIAKEGLPDAKRREVAGEVPGAKGHPEREAAVALDGGGVDGFMRRQRRDLAHGVFEPAHDVDVAGRNPRRLAS